MRGNTITLEEFQGTDSIIIRLDIFFAPEEPGIFRDDEGVEQRRHGTRGHTAIISTVSTGDG
jgi:hypothetical protein